MTEKENTPPSEDRLQNSGEPFRKQRERTRIRLHSDLQVYRTSFQVAVELYQLSKGFPSEERYSLTDQMRRSSRSVCANIAEAWRKRRYPAAFTAKLTDSEAEAAETQVWIEFAVSCGYLPKETGRQLYQTYHNIISMLIEMVRHPDKWKLK